MALSVILLVALSVVATIPMPAKAATIPLSEVQDAIKRGVDAVYDAVRPILVNSTYYFVMPDHPSPTVIVECNGKRYVPGSFFDPGDRDYETELVEVTSNSVAWRYKFNVDDDEDKDITLYLRLTNVNSTTDNLYIYVDHSECTFNLIVGTYSPYRFNNINEGWSTTISIDEYNDYKFHSARYVARHSTRIAAWLLEEEGYTYLASQMHAFMDMLGFTYDVYAPVFGKSNDYPDDFFEIHSTWLGNGYEAQPWTINDSYYINYPYKSRMYIFNKVGMLDQAIRGWEDMPLSSLLKAIHLLNKYGASRQAEAEQLIEHALEEGRWDGYGLKGSLLDPIYITTGQKSEEVVPYWYDGYPVYLNAVLLVALVRYYEVTGDQWIAGNDILYMADRLAGILVKLQWNYEEETPWGYVRLALFRGWWPAAYDIGSIIAKPSAWGLIDSATHVTDAFAGALSKVGLNVPPESLRPMPSEWPFAIVNSESTILAIKALKVYLELAQELGRAPIDVTADTLAWTNGVFVESGGGGGGPLDDSHGGETAGDGRWVTAFATTPGLAGDAWHYQYAKFKIPVSVSDQYNVTVMATVTYSTYDSLGSSDEIYLIVKLLDSSGNLIQQTDRTIASVNENGLYSGSKAVGIYMNVGNLPAGTYYVEVGLKVVADNGPASLNGAWASARAVIDVVAIEPSS